MTKTHPHRLALGRTRALRGLALAALLLGAVGLAGCGDDEDIGSLFLWNRTDSTTNEDVVAFTIAVDGGPMSGNILPGPLPPGDEDYLGDWREDIYDGTAELQGGTLVDFFNFFVGDEDDTILQVF